MPGKILGLDIRKDLITAVQVTSGLKNYEIISCCQVIIDEDGPLKAIESISQKMDIKSDICAAVIPAEEVSIRNLSLPFSDQKKIAQLLPFEIETISPFPLDELIVDFNISNRSKQSEIVSVSVKKEYISNYLSMLNQFGIDPDTLDIQTVPTASWLIDQQDTPENSLILDIGLLSNTMILFQKGRIALIRNLLSNDILLNNKDIKGDRQNLLDHITPEQIESCIESLSSKAHETLHSYKSQFKTLNSPEKVYFTGIGALYPDTSKIVSEKLNIPAVLIDISSDKRVSMGENISRAWKPALMDGALALTMLEPRKSQGFNLRKDEFVTNKHNIVIWKEMRKASVFLIIILIFLLADLSVGYSLLKRNYDNANNNLIEKFKQEFPDITRIVDPVQQARVKVNELKTAAVSMPAIKADQRVIDILLDISGRIPKALDVNVTNMVVDMETVRISGNTDSFNTVDSIKNGLEASTYFMNATISSANLDRAGERVQFEVKLQRVI